MARTNPKMAEFRNEFVPLIEIVKAIPKYRVKCMKIDNTLSLNDIHNAVNLKSCNFKVLQAFKVLAGIISI